MFEIFLQVAEFDLLLQEITMLTNANIEKDSEELSRCSLPTSGSIQSPRSNTCEHRRLCNKKDEKSQTETKPVPEKNKRKRKKKKKLKQQLAVKLPSDSSSNSDESESESKSETAAQVCEIS